MISFIKSMTDIFLLPGDVVAATDSGKLKISTADALRITTPASDIVSDFDDEADIFSNVGVSRVVSRLSD